MECHPSHALPGRTNGAPIAPGLLVPLLVLLAAILSQDSFGAADRSPETIANFNPIDAYIQTEMAATRLPGLALGIVKDARVVHLKGFGRADPAGRPVTPQTPFLIASLTKPFTALAIMQLVEAGRIELDAPVQRYLPWFRVAHPNASNRITVRQLLNHTSGLPTLTGHEYMVFAEEGGDDSLQERVQGLHTTGLTAPPGQRFQYSNANYATLALIIEAVSGQSYEQFLEEHIYSPLQMERSFVSRSEARQHGLATGYRYWFGFPVAFDWSYSRAELGAGFTISTAEDLSHFLVAELNGGRYAGRQILHAKGIAETQQPGPSIRTRSAGLEEYYGLGWFIREANGQRIVAHAGVAPNFHAELVLFPEERLGIVLLMNGENGLAPGRIAGMAGGVARLLAGPEVPVPEASSDYNSTLMQYLLLVLALQLVGGFWSIRRMRLWYREPERRPRGWGRIALHIIPPLLLNLLWGTAALLALPRFLMWPLPNLMLAIPDLGYSLVLSGILALIWGLLRPMLIVGILLDRG